MKKKLSVLIGVLTTFSFMVKPAVASGKKLFALEWHDNYLPVHICEKIVIENYHKKCVIPEILTISINVDMNTSVKNLVIKDPYKYVRFVLPKTGYKCNDFFLGGYECIKVPADKDFWKGYFIERENVSGLKALKSFRIAVNRLDHLNSIINRLNKGIENKEIPVLFKYDLYDSQGYGTFTLKIPKKYAVLLKEYVDIIGEPAVIGIEVNTPIVHRIVYLSLYKK